MTVKIDKKIVGYAVVDDEPKKALGDNAELPLEAEQTAGEKDVANVVHMHEKLKRPEMLLGSTYKIKTPLSEHALYVTINDIVLNPGTEYERRRPFGLPGQLDRSRPGAPGGVRGGGTVGVLRGAGRDGQRCRSGEKWKGDSVSHQCLRSSRTVSVMRICRVDLDGFKPHGAEYRSARLVRNRALALRQSGLSELTRSGPSRQSHPGTASPCSGSDTFPPARSRSR